MTIEVDHDGSEPPFEQVRRQVAALTASGAWAPGHRLPSVRAMAASLDLAVNTVAKAYKALEADGVVETRGRHGTVVASSSGSADLGGAADAYVAAARRAGVELTEALRMIEDRF